tara:strand:+ start:136 stop:1098 length:963 start_codon:yes stop_codon:yes gene_type:complete
MKILITGSCGFIGFSLAKFLLDKDYEILGIDNLNDYYSIKLKEKRLELLKNYKKFNFHFLDLKNEKKINKVFKNNKIDYVFHLAAQAGVRHSVDFPRDYIDSNILGFFNILENCKKKKVKRVFYASSSSVYGNSIKFPLKEDNILSPNNVYSLTKKFNEDISEVYSNYYKLKLTGLRFFTVYGEWGRPDMFVYKLLESCASKKPFYLNNYGNHFRDFTYIQDSVKMVYKLFRSKKLKGHDVFNICSNKPLKLNKIIKIVEKNMGKIKITNKKLQLADVIKTHGNNSKIKKFLKYKDYTKIETGILNTIKWFKKYKKIKIS